MKSYKKLCNTPVGKSISTSEYWIRERILICDNLSAYNICSLHCSMKDDRLTKKFRNFGG